MSEPVEIRSGNALYRGLAGPEGQCFLGIRYAEPPTGERRWRGPVPVGAWSGVVDARIPGPIAPQARVKAMDVGETAITDEDCLFTIINYELVRNDIDILKEMEFDIIIADEIHRIANWKTITNDAMKQLNTLTATLGAALEAPEQE